MPTGLVQSTEDRKGSQLATLFGNEDGPMEVRRRIEQATGCSPVALEEVKEDEMPMATTGGDWKRYRSLLPQLVKTD